jgi:lysozyme
VARRVLKRGSSGEDVRRLQRLLAAAGLDVVVDGDFGPMTEAAVRSFQAANVLEPDGIVGAETWKALCARPPREEPWPPLRDPRKRRPRKLSRRGAGFIAQFEGFRSGLYDDPAGHSSIGYGHLVHLGPTNGREDEEFRRGISQERALELLRSDADDAALAVRRKVLVPLTRKQFDALVSFVFNVGETAFAESTLLRELNAGRYEAVPVELNRWVKAGGRTLPGLVRRRGAEGVLFTDGRY